ncbi:MAG: hypothetical protein OJF49_003519 [Ktedonobacterales bacterium]|nr:MAG: hypothetical protein OJF49_003519 [Ktedonobacterales bacterium]
MLFNFQLHRMHDIAPWGPVSPDSRSPGWLHQPHLSWFGLTYGSYWIDVGQTELFRYSQAVVDLSFRKFPDAPWLADLPYVDYYVVRLWEDLLDLLPMVLEPVHARLVGMLAPNGPWATWVEQAEAAVNAAFPSQYDTARYIIYDVARWWWQRHLDTSYLQAGPNIVFWSDGADVHIQWDNRDCLLDDLLAWEAMLGESTLPVAAFLEEMRSFDARFLRRMRDRIAIAQADWARPDVALDPHPYEEHHRRVQWSRQQFEAASPREPTDWDAVFRAIARIESLPPFASGAVARLF